MANPKIYYANPGEYTLAASAGSHASFPLTNLQDFLRSSAWTSGGSTANQYVTVQFSSAKTCNYAILEVGDAFEVGWDSLTIQAADDAGMSVNKVDVYQGDIPASGTALFEFQAGDVSKVYWRFTLGGTLTEAPSIFNLFLGKFVEFSFPYEFGAKVADSSFQSAVGRSLSGIQRASQAVGGTRIIEVNFRLETDAVAAQFRTFHDTVRGRLRPFYFSPDGGTTLYYVNNIKDYNPVELFRYGRNNIETLVMETADSEVE